MAFEYKIDVPTEDGKGTEKVTLEFKDLSDVPSGLVRRNRRNIEAFMWDVYEWGLSPEHLALLDRVPADVVHEPFFAWRTSRDESPEAEDDSKPAKAKPAKADS